MTTVAAVLAAGRGHRFGGAAAKQHHLLGGRPVLTHSVGAFAAHDRIDEVWIVGPPDGLDRIWAECGSAVARVVAGGATRTESVARLVAALGAGVDRLIVHDAARPLVPDAVTTRVLDALDRADAVATVVPVVDTVVRLEADSIVDHLDRSTLRALQTPQGFRVDALRRGFAALAATASQPAFTDDVSLVAQLVPDAVITTVAGDPRLHKITLPIDLVLVEALLRSGGLA